MDFPGRLAPRGRTSIVHTSPSPKCLGQAVIALVIHTHLVCTPRHVLGSAVDPTSRRAATFNGVIYLSARSGPIVGKDGAFLSFHLDTASVVFLRLKQNLGCAQISRPRQRVLWFNEVCSSLSLSLFTIHLLASNIPESIALQKMNNPKFTAKLQTDRFQ